MVSEGIRGTTEGQAEDQPQTQLGLSGDRIPPSTTKTVPRSREHAPFSQDKSTA